MDEDCMMTEENRQMNMEEQDLSREEQIEEIRRVFQPEKSKIVRNELFATLRDASIMIRDGNITFNTACINGFEGVVYVNLCIDEEHRMLGVRPCGQNDKDAIRWCVAKNGKRKSRRLRCPEFTDLIYDLMGWDKKCRYRVLGFQVPYDDEIYYVFNLNRRRIYQERPKKGEEPMDADGNIIKTPVDRKGYLPEDIANTFGVPMEEARKEMESIDIGSFVQMEEYTEAKKAEDSQEENLPAGFRSVSIREDDDLTET